MAGAGFTKLMQDLNANNRKLQKSIRSFSSKGRNGITKPSNNEPLTFKEATPEEFNSFQDTLAKKKKKRKNN